MYKDKEKQREAAKTAKARWKAKQGIPQVQGIPVEYPDKEGIPRQGILGIVKGGICWCCGSDINMALTCCGPCAWTGKAKAKRAGREPPSIGQPAWEEMYVY